MKAIFICSKPLQLMISMILSRRYPNSDLIVLEGFNGAEDVAGSSRLNCYFDNVSFYRTRWEIIRSFRLRSYDRVLVDSDVGLQLQIFNVFAKIMNPSLNFSVYEEGIGTYRTDLIPQGLKKILYDVTGSSGYFGGSSFVDEILCFQPERYEKLMPNIKHQVEAIGVDFVEWIQTNQSQLFEIFPGLNALKVRESARCVVFLTDWEVDTSVIAHFVSKVGVFVKPHPHIRSEALEVFKNDFPNASWAPSIVPAEVMILYLLNYCSEIIVLHSNSSVAHYLRDLQSVKFVDIAADWKRELSDLGWA